MSSYANLPAPSPEQGLNRYLQEIRKFPLLEPEEVPAEAREYLKPYTVGISAITCFIGLDCTPEEIGFTTSFTLNYDSFDANKDFQDAYKLLPEHDPMVATCYTVDDPEVSPKGTSIITAGTLKYGTEWEKLSPEQYYDMKYEAGRRIVARLEVGAEDAARLRALLGPCLDRSGPGPRGVSAPS